MADVIGNGDAPNIRARITWAYPAALDAAATAVEVMMSCTRINTGTGYWEW
jgi:hypothetical protein